MIRRRRAAVFCTVLLVPLLIAFPAIAQRPTQASHSGDRRSAHAQRRPSPGRHRRHATRGGVNARTCRPRDGRTRDAHVKHRTRPIKNCLPGLRPIGAVAAAKSRTPTAPSNLVGVGGAQQASLSWSGSGRSVSGYRVYRNGTKVAQTSSTSYSDMGLTDGSSYTYYVVAYVNGSVSAASNSVSVTPVDTTPPSAPPNLAATAGDQQVSLSWGASTDNVAVAGYYVYRNGTKVTQTTSASYTNTGLTDGTSYSYYVVAYDAAGNLSAASNSVSVTPVDTTPPSAPPNLAATAGDQQVSLSWGASTDNVAVAGYYVYRNGTKVTQTTSASYTNTGLTDGTSYSYYVVAYDAAGNLSAASNSVSVTPIAGSTSDPSGQAVPVGNSCNAQGCWNQTYAEDFKTGTGIGSWLNGLCAGGEAGNTNYPDMCAYSDGWSGTPTTGTYYPSRSLSTANGLFDYALGPQIVNGTTYNVIDATVPKLSGSSVVGTGGGQLYGRYIVRARWDSIYGYHVSFLLWPDSDTWPTDGEIDFPEDDFDSTSVNAFEHWQGGTSGGSQYSWGAPNTGSQWHTYEIDWLPSSVTFLEDGVVIGQSTDTSKIPDTPMHWVLQTGLSYAETNLSLLGTGHLQVAWAVAYTPA